MPNNNTPITIHPDHLAEVRAHLLSKQNPRDAAQPHFQENLDLIMLAYEAAMISILTTTRRAHCPGCGGFVSKQLIALFEALFNGKLATLPLTGSAPEAEPEATTVHELQGEDELSVFFEALFSGQDPVEALAAYRRENGITAVPVGDEPTKH